MLPVSLDCLSSSYVLCTHCCQFLWIVCLRLMSCVPNVASFSGLFVFVLCLVYPMLPVSLDCLSSSYVLCTQGCQFLWIGCLRLMSCVPNVDREICNIGYTRHKAKTNNPEKPSTLGTQDIRRRQTIQRNWQHWVHKT
jgi:hypothetical protein